MGKQEDRHAEEERTDDLPEPDSHTKGARPKAKHVLIHGGKKTEYLGDQIEIKQRVLQQVCNQSSHEHINEAVKTKIRKISSLKPRTCHVLSLQ